MLQQLDIRREEKCILKKKATLDLDLILCTKINTRGQIENYERFRKRKQQFLDLTPKVQSVKRKIDKFDLIKI